VISWNTPVQLINKPSTIITFLHQCLITFAVASGDR
jgi:hypothetical protein